MGSRDWVREFVTKFDFWIKKKDPNARTKIENAVSGFLLEEFEELEEALDEGNTEEVVDALGDISWYCEKIMIQVGIDPQKVRDEIGRANMSKERGTKEGREWSGGFDAIKPEGWVKPDHSKNHGDLDAILKQPF